MKNKKFIYGLVAGFLLSIYTNRVVQLHNYYQSEYERNLNVETVQVYDDTSLKPKNEHEVYELNDNYNGIYYLPLKSLKVTVSGKNYNILSNNEGSAFVVEESLKNKQNYIGVISTINNEEVLHSLIESEFVFSENAENAFNMNIWENKVFFEREAVLLLNK